MFISKLLLNRQKIFNPGEIHEALARYFPQPETAGEKTEPQFFYRLEWYKIGVVVPIIMYSQQRPTLISFPECQLISTEKLPPLQPETTYDFSIFAVPELKKWDPAENQDAITSWLQKKLNGAAKISDCEFGPNNCIYYQKNSREKSQQTVTIRGSLRVTNKTALEEARAYPIGNNYELGCGLLLLNVTD